MKYFIFCRKYSDWDAWVQDFFLGIHLGTSINDVTLEGEGVQADVTMCDVEGRGA